MSRAKPNPETLLHSWRDQQADLREYRLQPDRVNFQNRIRKVAAQPKGKFDEYGIQGRLKGSPGNVGRCE